MGMEKSGEKGPDCWEFPEQVFSNRLGERFQALSKEFDKQIVDSRYDLAETTGYRLVRMSRYREPDTFSKLLQVLVAKQDIPALQKLWKRAAVSELERGDVNRFLSFLHNSIYAEHIYSDNPNYQYSVVDEDINSHVRFASLMNRMMRWVLNNKTKELHKSRPEKLNVGFVLPGFSDMQAPHLVYYNLAEHYDPNIYSLHYYSSFSLNNERAEKHNYRTTKKMLMGKKCIVRMPEKVLSPIEQVEFVVKSIVKDKIDILVFQTTYFVPVYNMISCMHPAIFQASICHQQPEYSHDIDMVLAPPKAVMDVPCQTMFSIITENKKSNDTHNASRELLGVPDNSILLMSVNRDPRYNQPEFWRQMVKVLRRHSRVYFLAVGLEERNPSIPTDAELRTRIIATGYRKDVLELMALGDVYVDLFPSGGGGSLLEAMRASLPAICIDQNYATPYNINNETVGALLVGEAGTIAPHNNHKAWHDLIDNLIKDDQHRNDKGRAMGKRIAVFDPKVVSDRFFREIECAYWEKVSSIEGSTSAGIKE